MSNQDTDFPSRRVIVLGASNAVRSLSTLVETSRLAWGEPVDFFGAIGHGRSYGLESWVLCRGLPGIVSCGLWNDLAARPAATTAAVLTDVGNDLLYEASVHQILTWVNVCLDRLQPVCEQIAITELPLASLQRVGPARFRLMRSVLFPRATITLRDALERAAQLNERLIEIAQTRNVRVVQPDAQWYGWDPIHVKPRYWNNLWGKIFQTFFDGSKTPPARSSLGRWLYLRRLRPQQRRWFRQLQQTVQPSGRFADGTTVSLY